MWNSDQYVKTQAKAHSMQLNVCPGLQGALYQVFINILQQKVRKSPKSTVLISGYVLRCLEPPALTVYIPRAKQKYQHCSVRNRLSVPEHWTDSANSSRRPQPVLFPWARGHGLFVPVKQHSASSSVLHRPLPPMCGISHCPLPSSCPPPLEGSGGAVVGSLSCQTAKPNWESQMWEVQQRQHHPSALAQALQSGVQVDILNKYNWHMIYRLHPFWRQVLYWDEIHRPSHHLNEPWSMSFTMFSPLVLSQDTNSF